MQVLLKINRPLVGLFFYVKMIILQSHHVTLEGRGAQMRKDKICSLLSEIYNYSNFFQKSRFRATEKKNIATLEQVLSNCFQTPEQARHSQNIFSLWWYYLHFSAGGYQG